MDKKTETKMKRKQRRLRASVFFRKNGLYVALAVCLAAIGGVAAAIFAFDGGGGGTPAEHSYDERIGDASASGLPAATPAPTPISIVLPTARPSVSPKTAQPSIMPDLTPAPSATPAPSVEPVVLTSPVDGSVIKVFAKDCLIYSKTLNQWMTHPGVDIAAPKGAEVRAVLAGTVTKVYKDDMLGVTVVIEHENGMRTVYSSLKEDPPAAVGQKVESRQLIGYIGDTAISECADRSHLHFELYIEGSLADPQKYVHFTSEPD